MPRITGSLLPALAAATLILGACTSTGATPVPSAAAPSTAASAAAPSGAADVCAEADAVKASLDSLASTDLKAVGKDGLSAAVDAVKAAVETLVASAGASVSTQATALKAALDNLGTVVAGLTSDASVAEKRPTSRPPSPASRVPLPISGVRCQAARDPGGCGRRTEAGHPPDAGAIEMPLVQTRRPEVMDERGLHWRGLHARARRRPREARRLGRFVADEVLRRPKSPASLASVSAIRTAKVAPIAGISGAAIAASVDGIPAWLNLLGVRGADRRWTTIRRRSQRQWRRRVPKGSNAVRRREPLPPAPGLHTELAAWNSRSSWAAWWC